MPISHKHSFTALSIAVTFNKDVIRLYDTPSTIVSDRDTVFLSLFWKELLILQGTQLHISTTYPPESQVVNKIMEAYLCCFILSFKRHKAHRGTKRKGKEKGGTRRRRAHPVGKARPLYFWKKYSVIKFDLKDPKNFCFNISVVFFFLVWLIGPQKLWQKSRGKEK